MAYLPSEIDIALKIGSIKLDYVRNQYEFDEIKYVLDKLDLNYYRDAYYDSNLSKPLRALTTHGGDISFDQFLIECKEQISGYNAKINLACFLLGIGYLYPPSSMGECLKYSWNKILDTEIKSLSGLYEFARTCYQEGIAQKIQVHKNL